MRIESPLSKLCERLEQVKNAAASDAGTLRRNEAATRTVLIDPILRELGWDLTNTAMVEVERTEARDIRADYALLDQNGNIPIIIEAKRLGTDLSQPQIIREAVRYAYAFQAGNLFLTDGLTWVHYTDFNPQNFTPCKQFSLSTAPLVEWAAYLVQELDAVKYWPEAQTIDILMQRITQLENLVATLESRLTLTAPQIAPQAAPAAQAVVPTAAGEGVVDNSFPGFIALEAVDPVQAKPVQLILSDGRVIAVRTWRDVLRETAKFVLENTPNLSIPLPDSSGKRVRIFHSAPFQSGISQIAWNYRDRPVYIYLNYDAIHTVKNAAYLAGLLPEPLRRAGVKVAVVQNE